MQRNDEQLKSDVMKRVIRLYVYKTCLKPFAIECGILGTLLAGSTFLVSAPHVLMNATATHSVPSFSTYLILSFERTEFPVKILTLAVLTIGLLIVRNAALGITLATRKSWAS